MATKKAKSEKVKKTAKERKPTAPKGRPGRKPKLLPLYDGPKVDVAVGQSQPVPLDKLNLGDTKFQIRATTKPRTLLEDVRAHGILNALLARPHPEKKGEYQLISGFNRAAAARELGLKDVPVIVQMMEDTAAFIFTFAENQNRQSLNDLDRAFAIKKLRDSGVAPTTADIARLFRLSERQVQHLEALLAYPQVLRDAVGDEASGVTATHALVLNQANAKSQGGLDLGGWIRKVGEDKLSVSDLKKGIRSDLLKRAPRKQLVRIRGDVVAINLQHLDGASQEDRKSACAQIEKLLVQLRG